MGVVDLVMMGLVVLVTVAGLQAVGLILVVSMLIIPHVAARFWTDRLWKLVLVAGLIGAASGYAGSVVSALLPRKPAGAVIVLSSGAFFAVSLLFAPARGLIALSVRRLRLRLRIAGDHLLEYAHEHAADHPDSLFGEAELRRVAAIRGWNTPFRALLLGILRKQGMVRRASNGHRGGVTVSPEGFARGARVARNHALWEQYLVTYADIAPSHVDWSVDQVEHVLSDGFIGELEQKLAARGVAVPSPQPFSADPASSGEGGGR